MPLASIQPLIPSRILSSTLLGENGEEIDKRRELIRNIEEKRRKYEEGKEIFTRDMNDRRTILKEQNRTIFQGIDIGVTEELETLNPDIRIPTEEDVC